MKRRAMFLLATMVATLLLASGVALAAIIISCSSSAICWGTVGNDVMIGSGGNDVMRGLGGDDNLSGGLATVDGPRGQTGDDTLSGGDGNDSLSGQPGNDILRGDADVDSLSGGNGDDTLSGGTGNDTYRFGKAWGLDSILSETAGTDTLRFDDVGSALSIDLGATATPAMELPGFTNKVSTPTGNVVIENAYGGSSFDAIEGNAGPNTLDGNAGNDEITGFGGADRMYGRVGDDTIYATDGLGDLVIDCGEDPDLQDIDTVYADQADSTAIINCERTLFAAAVNVPTCNGELIQLTANEKRTLDLHNDKRDANVPRLPPLCVHPALTYAARFHSQEMLDNDYFEHDSFNGQTFYETWQARLMRFGYNYSSAAENSYRGNGTLASPESAMDSWMGSNLHRPNILNGAFLEVGIGVRTGTFTDENDIERRGTNMYTVDFGVR